MKPTAFLLGSLCATCIAGKQQNGYLYRSSSEGSESCATYTMNLPATSASSLKTSVAPAARSFDALAWNRQRTRIVALGVQASDGGNRLDCGAIGRHRDGDEAAIWHVGTFEHGRIRTIAHNRAKALLRERMQIQRVEIDQADIVADGLQLGSDLGTDWPNADDRGSPYLIVVRRRADGDLMLDDGMCVPPDAVRASAIAESQSG